MPAEDGGLPAEDGGLPAGEGGFESELAVFESEFGSTKAIMNWEGVPLGVVLSGGP